MSRRDALSIIVPVMLAAILALGIGLRAEDPLSSPALGAEDPYTHVVFTKEHLARGSFDDSMHLATSLYPPGLHAFSGIFATTSGMGLYDFARFSPIAFGALAILGMYVLGARLGGPAGGLAAALVTAVLPEHVFRTNVFFPTMMDLALIPAFFYLFHVHLERRFALHSATPVDKDDRSAIVLPIVLMLLIAVVIAYAHPWASPLMGAMCALYAGLRVLRSGENAAVAARVLAWPAALLVVVVTLGSFARWDHGNTGFTDFFVDLGPLAVLAEISLPPALLFPVLLGVFGLAGAAAVLLGAAVSGAASRLPAIVPRLVGLALVPAAFAAVYLLTRELPAFVDYEVMLGSVPIALALVGLAIAFIRPTPLGDFGLAVCVLLFPFTAHQFFHGFDHQFWPSRTVAYLSIGVALLAAASVAWAADTIVRLVSLRRTSRVAVPAATLACVMMVGGAMAMSPAEPYGWYRLYTDEQFEGFQLAADLLEENPDVRVIVPGWQSGLMLKALAEPDQVRYAPAFYTNEDGRDRVLDEGPYDAVYVVVDKWLEQRAEDGRADLSLVDGYELVYRSSDGGFHLYRVPEVGR